MAEHTLSKDCESAVLAILEEFDLSPNNTQRLLKECAKLVSIFRFRHEHLPSQRARLKQLGTWCDETIASIENALERLAPGSGGPLFGSLDAQDRAEASAPLVRIEQRLQYVAGIIRDSMPAHRPRNTIADNLTVQLGGLLVPFGIPVVSSTEGAFLRLSEILWKEISGTDNVTLFQQTYKATKTLDSLRPRRQRPPLKKKRRAGKSFRKSRSRD